MINAMDKKTCSGCSACYNICPRQCISMIQDNEGFYYPTIDVEKCVNCGLCDKVCPFQATSSNHYETVMAYACKTNDDKIRSISSSGGIFSMIAQHILDNGGVVYGVAMSSDCRQAEFVRISDIDDLDRLRGSKYLQAEMANTLIQVKMDLDNDKEVLFSGTPCQVNGLKLFLRKDYLKLYTVDIICHGVPSSKLWSRYVDYVEDKKTAKVVNVNFRSKKFGWKDYGLLLEFENNRDAFSLKSENIYMQLFLRNYTLRPSCYACKSKELRYADISLGDLWGIESILPQLDDKKGTSFVILRSPKGKQLFDCICNIECMPINYHQAMAHNPAEMTSVDMPSQRINFYVDLEKCTIKEIKKKYLTNSLMQTIKHHIKKVLLSIRQ